MSNRAERRRQSRAHAKKPIAFVGEGIVGRVLDGSEFEAVPHRREPEKIPGKHRWIATVAYNLTDQEAAGWNDKDVVKKLDNSRLMYMAIGCLDCEKTIVEVGPDSECEVPAT